VIAEDNIGHISQEKLASQYSEFEPCFERAFSAHLTHISAQNEHGNCSYQLASGSCQLNGRQE